MSEESVRTDLPNYPVSLLRAAAPWKRAATATTSLPAEGTQVSGWMPDPGAMADYRRVVGSAAQVPIAFPQVPIMALHIDLLSRWSFPVRAMGLVHQGTTIEVLDEVPAAGPWQLRAWVAGARHVRSGLEFDVVGEVGVDGQVCWRSSAVLLSRSRTAAGAEESAVPRRDVPDRWAAHLPVPVDEGAGRAFGRITGDINPIHLHAVSARLFGFPRAIAHGWWTTARVAALLGADATVAGRTLQIAFRRPVLLPSTPVLASRSDADGIEFALLPEEVRAPVAGDRPVADGEVAPLVRGRISG
ncbi:MAG: MaoC/PaaZ C-terminal domain-containing protein [Candidatus Nanopelagicales bacterium]